MARPHAGPAKPPRRGVDAVATVPIAVEDVAGEGVGSLLEEMGLYGNRRNERFGRNQNRVLPSSTCLRIISRARVYERCGRNRAGGRREILDQDLVVELLKPTV